MKRVAVVALAGLVLAAPAAAAPSISATATPSTVKFGEPFRYVVEAHGSGALRVLADPGGFDQVAAVSTQRVDGGVRVEQTLVCLQRSCVPGSAPRRVLLPAPRVGVTRGAAVSVTVVPRVPQTAVAAARANYRLQTAIAPDRTWFGFAWVSAALAVLLLGAAAWLVRRPHRAAEADGRPALDLRRALRLLRESASRPTPDRRRAADYASRAARAAGADGAPATELAWAPPPPEPTGISALADELEGSA